MPFAKSRRFDGNPSKAVASGALLQFRFLGGVVGLWIAANVLNSKITTGLETILDSRTLSRVLDNIEVLETLPLEVRAEVARVFAQGYNRQLYIMIRLPQRRLSSWRLAGTRTGHGEIGSAEDLSNVRGSP